MNTLDQLFPLVYTQFFQATIVSLLAVFFAWVCRNRAPHLAYAILILALIKSLTPPIIHSPIGLFGSLTTLHRTTSSVDRDFQIADEKLTQPAPSEMERVESTYQQPAHVASSPVHAHGKKITPSVAEICLAIWFVGVVAISAIIWRRWRAELWRIENDSREADGSLAALRERLTSDLGIRSRVRLLVCSSDMGPLSFGILRPTIVVPQALIEQGVVMRPILTHELLHIRRRDPFFAFLQIIATTLWWFHPVSWLLSSGISRLRERCCDDETLATNDSNPALYADAILKVARLKHRLQGASLAVGLRPVELTRERLENIMNFERKRTPKTSATVWGTLCIGLFLILPGARAETGHTEANANEVAAESGSFPSFMVYKVRTELQRRICQRHFDIANPTVVVLADGDAHLSRRDDKLSLAKSFKDELSKVISNHQELTPNDKTGGLVIRMLLASPSSIEELANRPSTREARLELEAIGKELGFAQSEAGLRYYAQSDADVSVYGQYVCGPLMKGSNAPSVQEPKVGDNRVAVYPVRTKLSRGLTGGADCVIEYLSPIDSKTDSIATDDLKEFISACVKRAQILETDKRLGTVIHVATSTFDSSQSRMKRQFQVSDELREFHKKLGLDPIGTLTHTHN